MSGKAPSPTFAEISLLGASHAACSGAAFELQDALAGVTGWLTGSLFLGTIAALVVVTVVAVVRGRSCRACDG